MLDQFKTVYVVLFAVDKLITIEFNVAKSLGKKIIGGF